MTSNPAQPTPPTEDQHSEALKSLVGMLRFLFWGLRLLIIVVFVVLLFGGVFNVEEYQRAMLFRFGKLVVRENQTDPYTFGSGWYWGWPAPIDRVQKIPAGRSITVRTDQFWSEDSAGSLSVADRNRPQKNTLIPGEDGYVVTGDANIMHMAWYCTYRIEDPKRYYLGLYTPEEGTPQTRGARQIIRSVLENAALREVARWPVESVYRMGRRTNGPGAGKTLDKAVADRFREEVRALDLGIEVQDVGVTRVTPPGETQAAFREVADAANEYQTKRDEADAFRERELSRARGERASILADARAYRERIQKNIRADVEAFLHFRREFRNAPRATLLAFYLDALRDVLEAVDNKYVLHTKSDGEQEVRLQLSPKPRLPRTVDGTPGDESPGG